MKTVKVAEFRNSVDNLFRIANQDYHACVGTGEVTNWVRIAQRVRDEVLNIECKRASDYDKEQHQKALAMVDDSLAKSVGRIERYEQAA